MAKTKISEFSSTPANNTDIDSINIAEGCAPSGINDAIRELMAQLKDFQTGAQGDSFNGPIGTSTAAAGAFTTLSATGAITSTLATGTAPLVIASTTKVANLNVDLLDGADWASPAALGSTTPAAVSATTLSASSSVTLSGGTANGVAYLNGSKVVTSGSALVFDGTNLGLGVTPSAWSGLTALQLTGNGSLAGVSNAIHLSFNTYYNGTNWIYNTTANASNYYQGGGQHIWRTAASGTAGNAVTFTQAMTLSSDGNLGVGTTSPSDTLGYGKAIDIQGTAGSALYTRSATNSSSVYGVFSYDTNSVRVNIGAIGTNNYIRFLTASSERMVLDASGNLGVGTSSPASRLDVANSATPVVFSMTLTGAQRWQQIIDTTYGNWTLKDQTAGTDVLVATASTGRVGIGTSLPASLLTLYGATSQIHFTNTNTGTTTGDGMRIGMGGGSSTDGFINLLESTNLIFNTGGSERLRIDSAGNLGLGVAPSAWVSSYKAIQVNQASLASYQSGTDVNAVMILNAYADTAGSSKYLVTGAAAAQYSMNATGRHAWFIAPSGTAGNAITFTQAMTLDASGNLGLGETSPSAIASGFTTMLIKGANGGGIRCGTTNQFYIYSDSTNAFLNQTANGYMAFATNNTERARIDSSGNLLVGTTSQIASTRSVIAGSSANAQVIYFNNTRNNGSGDATAISLLGSSDNNTSNYHFIGTTGGTDRVYIFGNGNIQNTNNSYGAISDVKLKENIVDTTPKLADLMQVKVRNYNLIGDTAKQLGVVAQELETVFPSMVEESPDRDAEGNDLGTTTKSVKYSVFVPMLIKALQELKAEFDAYKASHP